MTELATLFQQMSEQVIQQERAVEVIETGAGDTHDNMVEGNKQMGIAVKSARAARKKKWICLGLVGKSIELPGRQPSTR